MAILEAIRDLGLKIDMVTERLKAVLVKLLLSIFRCNQTLLNNSFVAEIQTVSLGYLTACLSMPALSSPCFAKNVYCDLQCGKSDALASFVLLPDNSMWKELGLRPPLLPLLLPCTLGRQGRSPHLPAVALKLDVERAIAAPFSIFYCLALDNSRSNFLTSLLLLHKPTGKE